MPPVKSGNRQNISLQSGVRENQFSYLEPKHIYECFCCGRKFRRKTMKLKLNPHKDKQGYPCPGRAGDYLGYE